MLTFILCILAPLLCGLAYALKLMFPKLNMWHCFSIAILIISGIFLSLVYAGMHVVI